MRSKCAYVILSILFISLLGSVAYAEAVPPQFYDNFTSKSTPLIYYPDSNIGFQINCTDETSMGNALFETGGTNYTMSNDTVDIFYYNLTDQAVGTITYKLYCNDSSNNTNSTDSLNFVISRALPVLMMNNTTTEVNNSALHTYWKLDGSAEDFSGNERVGTLKSDAAYASVCKFGECCYFSGGNDRIEPVTSVYSNTGYSISVWFLATGFAQYIYSEGNTVDNDPKFGISISTTTNKTNIYIKKADGTTILSSSSAGTWTPNAWNHIVWTDNNGDAALYINGVLDSTNFDYVYQDLGATLNKYALASLVSATGYGNAFVGYLDEFMIFSRALPADEVKELYQTSVMYPYETNVSCRASDSNLDSSLNFYRNTTAVSNPDVATYGAQNSYYVCNVSQTENYTRSSFMLPFDPTKNSTTPSWMNLSIDSSGSLFGTNANYTEAMYPNATNATGNYSDEIFISGPYPQDITFTLYRNGTEIGTSNGVNDSLLLSAGYWNYTYYTAGNENYTGATLHYNVTISQNTSAQNLINLTIGEGAVTSESNYTAVYHPGTGYNATGNYTDSDFANNAITFTLYENTTSKGTANPIETSGNDFGVSYRYYNYSIDGNENYSSAYKFYNLTITQNTTNPVNLYLNGTQDNRTLVYPDSINATAEAIYSSSGTLKLYRNETDAGATEQNIRLGNGTYAYKANITENENYSSNSTGITFYAFVNKGTLVTNLSFNGTQADSAYNTGEIANLTAWSNATIDHINTTIYMNLTGALENMTESGEIVTSELNTSNVNVSTYNVTANTSGSENYTDSEASYILTVNDTGAPEILLFSLSQNSIVLGNSVTISWNTTDNDNVSHVRITSGATQIINTTYATNSTTYTPASAGTETIRLDVYDSNLNSATQSLALTITSASVPIIGNLPDQTDANFVEIGEEVQVFLKEDELQVIMIERSTEVPITLIQIIPSRDISGASMTVNILQPSGGILLPPCEVYSYMQVEARQITQDDIKNAFIGFRVIDDWLEEKDADPSEIRLMRYGNQTWKMLETSQTSYRGGYYYYKAETDWFGSFAIMLSCKECKNIFEVPVEIIRELMANHYLCIIIAAFITIMLYTIYILHKMENEIKSMRRGISRMRMKRRHHKKHRKKKR